MCAGVVVVCQIEDDKDRDHKVREFFVFSIDEGLGTLADVSSDFAHALCAFFFFGDGVFFVQGKIKCGHTKCRTNDGYGVKHK